MRLCVFDENQAKIMNFRTNAVTNDYKNVHTRFLHPKFIVEVVFLHFFCISRRKSGFFMKNMLYFDDCEKSKNDEFFEQARYFRVCCTVLHKLPDQ